MTNLESWRAALDGLRSHKLRAGLTTLGIMFGVGAVIAMLAIGAGAGLKAQAMIDRLGVHNVILRAKTIKDEKLEEVRKKSLGLSPRDAEAIAEAVPGVVAVAPRARIEPWKVMARGRKTEAQVFGTSAGYRAMLGIELSEGQFFDERDERHQAQVAVIGEAVRRDLFGYGAAIGQPLKVNDVWLEVIGVLAGDGLGAASFQGVAVGSADREILLPVSTAMQKFARNPKDSPFAEIVLRLEPGTRAAATGAVARTLIDRLHGGADDYEMVVPEALLAQSRQTQRLFSLVMGCIAGISLLVGGIGIMNIMLASVLERTREIGIRRAVGAKRRDIMVQFLTEAFSLSALGGLAGVLSGVLIAKVVAASAGWPTVVTTASVLLSFGVALAVGLISGLYPAHRASLISPIEALRYE